MMLVVNVPVQSTLVEVALKIALWDHHQIAMPH
jgi:hypothetical protein